LQAQVLFIKQQARSDPGSWCGAKHAKIGLSLTLAIRPGGMVKTSPGRTGAPARLFTVL
jgi:hypothetical protein